MAYVFKVEDMTCGGCAASVKGAVQRLPGVQKVETEVDSRRVVVEHQPGVAREAVEAAIKAAGYTEVSVLAS